MRIEAHDCVYCGAMAQGLDHIIPVSYSCTTRSNATWNDDEVVPACRECNCLLSNKWLPSIQERAAHLFSQLIIRHKQLLRFPDWTEAELTKVGMRLQKQIRAKLKNREFVKERIQHAERVAELSITPLDVWAVNK